MVAERVEVSAEQRNLSPAAYKNADGSRRAAGRIIANMEYEKETKAYEQQADDAVGYAELLRQAPESRRRSTMR